MMKLNSSYLRLVQNLITYLKAAFLLACQKSKMPTMATMKFGIPSKSLIKPTKQQAVSFPPVLRGSTCYACANSSSGKCWALLASSTWPGSRCMWTLFRSILQALRRRSTDQTLMQLDVNSLTYFMHKAVTCGTVYLRSCVLLDMVGKPVLAHTSCVFFDTARSVKSVKIKTFNCARNTS